MIRDLGTVKPGTTLYLPFHTFDSNDPSASVTLTGLAVTDIEIYSNGSVTQRASDSGYALLDTDGIDFDGITGIHGISIDLADNTTAGFYAAGNQYWVVISSVTVDAATINFVLCTFRIGYLGALLDTTIATLASQTSFTLTAGPAEDNALLGMYCVIHDVASAVQMGYGVISGYTGATRTVTLAAGTTFTAAATDNISIMGLAPLQPTTLGRTLDVSAGGEAGVDWANVGSPTTSVGLTGTTISTSQGIASVSGAVGSVTGNVGGNVAGSVGSVTAGVTVTTNNDKSGYALTATTGLGNQTANITGNLSGSVGSVTGAVGSVTGAVGSVTGNVGGDVVGSVGSLTNLTVQASTTLATGTHNPQTGDSFARIGAAGAGLSAVPWNSAWDAEVQSEVNDGLVAYDAATGTDIAGLNNLSAAQVNAEMVDALNTDTYAEPGQGAPGATISLAAKISYLYKFMRNRVTVTSSQISVYNDDGTTIGQKSTHSDNGTTYDRGEFTTGA